MTSKNDKSVILISPFFHPNIGGVESHLLDYTSALHTRGVNFVVYTLRNFFIRPEANRILNKDTVTYYPWPIKIFSWIDWSPILVFLCFFPPTFFITWRAVIKHSGKVVHAQGITALLACAILKKFYKFRLVVTLHSFYESVGISLPVVRSAMRAADSVLCVSQTIRDQVERQFKVRSVRTVKYWVNTEIFKRGATDKDPIAGGEKSLSVAFVSRYIEKKGVKEFVELARRMPNLRFISCGEGPLSEFMRSQSIKIPNLVDLGPLDQMGVAGLLAKVDVLLILSKYPEGFGRVLLEAMACGVVPIGFNQGEIPKVIKPGVGYIVGVGDLDAVQGHLLQLSNNRVLLESLSNESERYVQFNYSVNNAEDYIAQYEL